MATGVILSGSDFVSGSLADAPWNSSTKDIIYFDGGITGSAQQNSLLSSPITTGGTNCRKFVHDGTNRPYGFYLVSSSIDSGIYAGPYSTSKAYSVRAWLRRQSGNALNTGIGIILRNKFDGTTSTIADSAEVWNIIPGGYTLQMANRGAFFNPGNSDNYLYLQVRDPDNPASAGLTAIKCSGSGANDSYSFDEWHRVRVDLIPVAGLGDQINVYTSSAGDVSSGNETWEEVANTFVAFDDDAYVEPSDSNSAMGFYAFSQSTGGQDAYIDLFEIAVEDI